MKTRIKSPKVSFFKSPVSNINPYKTVSIKDVYKAITGSYLKQKTEILRSIQEPAKNRKYKAENFPYVTFSGIFSQRKEAALIKHSGLLVIDFDKLQDVESLKSRLLKECSFETQLLFVSPNGNGLKWIIEIDIDGKYSHGQLFDAICYYIKSTHDIQVDRSGRDISRACFICYDSTAYIHPKYLIHEEF